MIRAKVPRPFAALALTLLLVTGCAGDRPLTEVGTQPATAELQVLASLTGTDITALVVEVSAPDIPEPLIFNIPVGNDVASGTISVPAGSDRLITVRAYDANGIETHRGTATVNVREGQNPTVSIVLLPLVGNVPIEVTVGSLIVQVDPGSATLAPNETVQLMATVMTGDGNPVPGTPVWGSTNPVIASVNQDGVVTAHLEGEAEIVANFGNARGSAHITVTGDGEPPEPPGPGGSIMGPVYPPEFPLENVTFTDNGVPAGTGTGAEFSFTDFDVGAVFAMAWGHDPAHDIVLSLDGSANETLTFSADDSDLPAGVLVWTGSSPFTYRTNPAAAFQTITVPTRLTVTVSDGNGPIGLFPAADAGLDAQVGGLAPVMENYPAGGSTSPFTVHLLTEALFNGTWTPALDLFNGVETPAGVQAFFDFYDGFYWVPFEQP